MLFRTHALRFQKLTEDYNEYYYSGLSPGDDASTLEYIVLEMGRHGHVLERELEKQFGGDTLTLSDIDGQQATCFRFKDGKLAGSVTVVFDFEALDKRIARER